MLNSWKNLENDEYYKQVDNFVFQLCKENPRYSTRTVYRLYAKKIEDISFICIYTFFDIIDLEKRISNLINICFKKEI